MTSVTETITIEYVTDLYGTEADVVSFASLADAFTYVQSVAAGLRSVNIDCELTYQAGRQVWTNASGEIVYRVR